MRIISNKAEEVEERHTCECCTSIIGLLKTDIETYYECNFSPYYGHGHTYWTCPICNRKNIIKTF